MTDLDNYIAAMPADRQQIINDKGRRLASAFSLDNNIFMSIKGYIVKAL